MDVPCMNVSTPLGPIQVGNCDGTTTGTNAALYQPNGTDMLTAVLLGFTIFGGIILLMELQKRGEHA